MSSLITTAARTVRYWGCGGTGINMVRAHRDDKPSHPELTAVEQFTFVDTSAANLQGVNENDVFRVPGLGNTETDGSGKDRSKNAEAVYASLDAIMLAHKPADLNVVVFNCAGGSGSVAGPLIWERLLSMGKVAVGVVTGGHESLKSTLNTINTLQGLELAVGRIGRPMVMRYDENDPAKTPSENNVFPQFVMSALSILGSGKNAHLDSADVRNLFDYQNVTHHQPALAMLNVYADGEKLVQQSKGGVYCLGALLKDRKQVVPQVGPDYDTVGYMSEEDSHYDQSFYFTVGTTGLSNVFKALNERKEHIEQQKRVSARPTSLVSNGVTANASGLVL